MNAPSSPNVHDPGERAGAAGRAPRVSSRRTRGPGHFVGVYPFEIILQRIAALRSLLRRDGARGVPIEITEIDANDNLVSAASWSQAIAGLDTTLAAAPSCHVSGIFAYMAGPPTGSSDADAGGWFTLFGGDGSLNTVGIAYLDSMHRAVSHIATRRQALC